MANSAQSLSSIGTRNGLTQKQAVMTALPKRQPSNLVKITITNADVAAKYVSIMHNEAQDYSSFAGISFGEAPATDKITITSSVPGGFTGLRAIFRDWKPLIIGFNYSCTKNEDTDQFDNPIYQLVGGYNQQNVSLSDRVSSAQSYNEQEQFMRMIEYALALNGQNDLVLQVKAGATVSFFFQIPAYQVLNS